MNIEIKRQGDIPVFTSGDFDLTGAVEVPRDAQGRLVLALGEVTGHAHVVLAEYVKMLKTNDGVYLVSDLPFEIVHDEHAPIPMSAGTHLVHRQREWTDADEPRLIAD